MKSVLTAALWAATLSFSAPSVSLAATVSYTFTGTVSTVTSNLPGISLGDTFSGGFTFDDSIGANPSGNPDQLTYNALTNFYFNINSFSGNDSGAEEIQVDNNIGGSDRYFVLSRGATGSVVDSRSLVDFSVLLIDFNGTAFSNADLNQDLTLANFGFTLFRANYGPEDESFFAGELATLSEVPVPAALPLFASALIGGGVVAWRKRRRTSAA